MWRCQPSHYPPPGSKRHHEIGNATPKPRLHPQHRKSQVLWRVSIRYRPLIGPVQAWCYQSRDGALNRGGGDSMWLLNMWLRRLWLCVLCRKIPVSRHPLIKLEQKVTLCAANKIGHPLLGEMLLCDKLPTFHFRLSLLLSLRSKVGFEIGFTAKHSLILLNTH